ncbi:hypothetical protein DL95DRAFT_494590, partial [Leptodontidium sp. 2 PMI_412]
MAHRTPRARYIPQRLPQESTCLHRLRREPLPTPLIKTMIVAMSVLIAKFQNTPDMSAVMQARTTVQNNLKTTVEIV